MKLEIIDTKKLNLPEVTSSRIFTSGKKFHPEGLFSEQIFGPVNSYQCWCKNVSAPTEETCKTCGIKITSSILRRQQFAKIVIPQIIHPLIWQLLQSIKSIANPVNDLLLLKKAITLKGELIEIKDEIPDPKEALISYDGIEFFIKQLINKGKDKSEILRYLDKTFMEGIFFTENIIVVPPDLRPISKDGLILDDINNLYMSILDYKNKDTNLKTYISILQYRERIQQLVAQISNYVLERLGKKSGLLRSKLEGKRVDFSGRAVISVDPLIPITHCKVSRFILLRLWQLDIANVFFKQKRFLTFKASIDFIEEQLNTRKMDENTIKILDQLATNQIVILNRQPTLHKGSMVSFRVIPDEGYVIKLNPLVCESFNADFDGDQMAIYRPLSTFAIKEAERMMAPYNFVDPANGELHFKPKQDIVYGIYKISQTKAGRERIANALNLQLEDIPENLKSKKINELIQEQAANDYRIFDTIKQLGLSYTEKYPVTMSIVDFLSSKKHLNLTQDKDKDKILLDDTLDEVREKFALKDVIDSGARASWDQAKQMLVARGYVSDFKGEIVPYGIENSFAEGLTPEQFFVSSFGTRKGLLDVAENTSDSGYLTRRLVYASLSSMLSKDVDCGTKRTLPIFVEDIDLAKTLIMRYYYDKDPLKHNLTQLKNITKENYEQLVGKTIYLRSPMLCEGSHICKTCYGDLANIIGTKYLGVIASQSIGERSLQLVLRTFHTSGVAQGKNLNKQEDIISALQQVEKLLDKTIAVTNINSLTESVLQLHNIFKQYGYIHLVHYEIINTQRHWTKNKQRWRTHGDESDWGQLLGLKQVPANESWFLAIIFQNISKVVNGLFANSETRSVLERIALGDL